MRLNAYDCLPQQPETFPLHHSSVAIWYIFPITFNATIIISDQM